VPLPLPRFSPQKFGRAVLVSVLTDLFVLPPRSSVDLPFDWWKGIALNGRPLTVRLSTPLGVVLFGRSNTRNDDCTGCSGCSGCKSSTLPDDLRRAKPLSGFFGMKKSGGSKERGRPLFLFDSSVNVCVEYSLYGYVVGWNKSREWVGD